jgi:hypothetical protein
LQGDERFIPVKNDDSRILTCFLEYFPHHVMVHDMLYEKQAGKWIQKVSSYPKLRLDVALLTDLLQKNGIQLLKSEIINRMIILLVKKLVMDCRRNYSLTHFIFSSRGFLFPFCNSRLRIPT